MFFSATCNLQSAIWYLAHQFYLVCVYHYRSQSSQHLDIDDHGSFFRIDSSQDSFHTLEVSCLEQDHISFLERDSQL